MLAVASLVDRLHAGAQTEEGLVWPALGFPHERRAFSLLGGASGLVRTAKESFLMATARACGQHIVHFFFGRRYLSKASAQTPGRTINRQSWFFLK